VTSLMWFFVVVICLHFASERNRVVSFVRLQPACSPALLTLCWRGANTACLFRLIFSSLELRIRQVSAEAEEASCCAVVLHGGSSCCGPFVCVSVSNPRYQGVGSLRCDRVLLDQQRRRWHEGRPQTSPLFRLPAGPYHPAGALGTARGMRNVEGKARWIGSVHRHGQLLHFADAVRMPRISRYILCRHVPLGSHCWRPALHAKPGLHPAGAWRHELLPFRRDGVRSMEGLQGCDSVLDHSHRAAGGVIG